MSENEEKINRIKEMIKVAYSEYETLDEVGQEEIDKFLDEMAEKK